VHGDTEVTPYGLGTYGSRSTPVSGAATALVARKVRERAPIVASAMLEVSPDDLSWDKGPPARWHVKRDPEKGETFQDIAMAAHGAVELPKGSRQASTPRSSAPRGSESVRPSAPHRRS
jgi:carbon-monoxide dehydrogenase large subunit